MNNNELPVFLSEREVAKMFGVSCACLQKCRWQGYGGPPYIKVGRLVRYEKSDVLAWIDGKRVTSRPPLKKISLVG